jgi:ribosomal protein S18 acetylase RimI-like enzyme
MENIKIEKVTIDKIDQLQSIGKLTFSQTFSSTNTQENMAKYLEEGFSVQKLAKELNNPDSEFYFALADDIVVGYLKINFGKSQTELQDRNSLEIERIYVITEFHGKKIGQLLYEKAISIAKKRSANYVWLGVWEENKRALKFYEKNGFKAFDKHIFRLGDDEQTDIMMRLDLL